MKRSSEYFDFFVLETCIEARPTFTFTPSERHCSPPLNIHHTTVVVGRGEICKTEEKNLVNSKIQDLFN
jgi:hypothetical protein